MKTLQELFRSCQMLSRKQFCKYLQILWNNTLPTDKEQYGNLSHFPSFFPLAITWLARVCVKAQILDKRVRACSEQNAGPQIWTEGKKNAGPFYRSFFLLFSIFLASDKRQGWEGTVEKQFTPRRKFVHIAEVSTC